MRYIVVGILNTLIGTTIMFLSYSFLGLGYWLSSFLNYFFGSIFSFYANKYYTFKSTQKTIREIIFFIGNILVCYVLAYGLAVYLVKVILEFINLNLSLAYVEQIALGCGMILFVLFNYLGQKQIVFNVKTTENR